MSNIQQVNRKSKGGRPRKYSVGTTSHTITPTAEGWAGFSTLSIKLGADSRSELFDRIGKGEFELLSVDERWEEACGHYGVKSPSELCERLLSGEFVIARNHTAGAFFESEIPVISRIKSLFGQKSAHPRFLSFLWFIRRISLGLGIIEDTYNNENFIEEIVLSSISCICIRDFIFPDELVTNVLADIRWVAFHLLLKKAGINHSVEKNMVKGDFSEPSKDTNTDILDEIFIALENLRANYPHLYQVFNLRYIQGLTGSQIQRLLEVRGSQTSLESISAATGMALKHLRQSYHEFEQSELDDYKKIKKEELFKKSKIMEVREIIKTTLPFARAYYYELVRPFLDFRSLTDNINKLGELEYILQESRLNWHLDFMLSELDHIGGHDIDRDKKRVHIKEIQQERAKSIREKFDEELQSVLQELKEMLKYGGNSQSELKSILMNFIQKKYHIDLDEQVFLKEKYTIG